MLGKVRRLFNGAPPRAPAPTMPHTAPAPVLDVTDADFDAVVGASTLPAIVDFWAEWCEPCKIVSAYVDFLAKDLAGQVLIAALDADENPVVAERFNVLGLPTLLVLHQGKEIDRIIGVAAYEEIKERISTLLATLA